MKKFFILVFSNIQMVFFKIIFNSCKMVTVYSGYATNILNLGF